MWIRRHRLAAAMVLLLVTTIVLSTAGVIWQTAHATRQRRIAQERLHDLVRLTGILEGELYDSVNPLPHSESARNSLLKGATDTFDTLAHDDSKDPVLALQVAEQYEKLARLQLTLNTPQATANALADINKGIALLQTIPATDDQHPAAQKQRAALQSLHPTAKP